MLWAKILEQGEDPFSEGQISCRRRAVGPSDCRRFFPRYAPRTHIGRNNAYSFACSRCCQARKAGCTISLHHHSVDELQYVLSGTGILRDANGNEYPMSAGMSVYCAPRPEGAHEFENTGSSPLAFLFVFRSPGGKFPEIYLIER